MKSRKKSAQRRQLGLKFQPRGGAREGAGRPKTSNKVPHTARPKLASRHPVHVTLDVLPELPSLRHPKYSRVIWGAFADAADQPGFRLIQFSIQDRHLHLIVEAQNARALARGIQGLKVRIARRLNKRLGRSGPLFADRYHARILRTPREVYYALRYVLTNAFKHQVDQGLRDIGYLFDICSSAAYFDGWQRGYSLAAHRRRGPPPVAPPHTWLLRKGWRQKHGRLPWNAGPARQP